MTEDKAINNMKTLDDVFKAVYQILEVNGVKIFKIEIMGPNYCGNIQPKVRVHLDTGTGYVFEAFSEAGGVGDVLYHAANVVASAGGGIFK